MARGGSIPFRISGDAFTRSAIEPSENSYVRKNSTTPSTEVFGEASWLHKKQPTVVAISHSAARSGGLLPVTGNLWSTPSSRSRTLVV